MSGPNEPVTLATIAERAGVHVSTVSRALRPGAPRNATAERIRAIADEFSYHPHPVASALRTQRTNVIGVLVPRLTDYVIARIYEGVDEAAFDAGYTTIIANTGDSEERRLPRLRALLARRVDGIVISDARLQDDEVIDYLDERGVPYVLVARRRRGSLSATTNDLVGGRLAGEHIAELGHVRVGVVAGEQFASTGRERTQGFLRAFEAVGHPIPQHLVIPSHFDVEGGLSCGRELLRRAPDLTAIFAANDFTAIGVMGALREHGLRAGRDVAVVGYNDVPAAAQMPVPLTSVASPMFRMGIAATETLLGMMRGEQRRSVRLMPRLVVRESTKP